MTREVAIKAIQDFIGWFKEDSLIRKALDMAIQALEQEPCIYDLKNRYCPRLNEHGMLKYPLQEPTVTSTDKPMTMVYPTIVCDDAVSRQSVLEAVSEGCQEWRGIYGRCEKLINELPSVNPQPCDDAISREYLKKIAQSEGAYGYVSAYDIATAPSVTQKSGKWIDYRDDGFVECPFCGHATNCEDDIDELHYCFYCGARMVEPQESEDKE